MKRIEKSFGKTKDFLLPSKWQFLAMHKRPHIVLTEIIHENPWTAYKHDVFEFSDGTKGDYYYVENPSSGCAMVVPVLDDGRLLLVSQYRYLRDKISIEFPCGGIAVGEQPEVTARRELLEETGYEAGELSKAGAFEALPAYCKDTTHLFVARKLTKVSELNLELTEQIETMVRRPDELNEMIRRGEVWDGHTLSAWALVRDLL